jgi:hypothetical protein
MSMSVRIDAELYEQAKSASKGEHRTIAGQLEFWAKVGRASLDNPDLPVEFVRDLLIAMSEPRDELTPFVPRSRQAKA